MNRLYLLGALALAEVSAYLNGGTTVAAPTTSLTFVQTTYTATGDCFTTGTATTLGMNNIYYQYYTFSISAGTQTYSISYDTDPAATNIVNKVTNAVGGCTHEHLYNWMAQPAIGSSAVTDGIGDALVAYGYVMGGSTLAACTLTVTAVTTTLYSSSIFSGGRFQYVNAILTLQTATAAATSISTVGVNMLTHYGLGSLQTVAGTIQALSIAAPLADGIATASAQNFYYDFAQQQVVQGQTQFGRGGGASTAPCGWWVFYAHEGGIDDDGGATAVSAWNVLGGWQSVTMHMWTDNALINTIGAFTIATLATLY